MSTDLARHILTTPLADTHEHLRSEQEYVQEGPDILQSLFDNYVTGDLAVAGAPIVGALGQSAPQAAKLCGVAIDPSLERLVTPVVLPLLGGFSESFREVLPVAICVCIAFGAGCAGLGFAAGKRSSRDGR